MKKINIVIAALVTVSLAVFVSCSRGKSPTGPGDTLNGGAVIAPQTKVVDDVPNLTATSVTDNAITYSYTGKAPSIKTGDVLVSGEENGYLRKVTAVSVSTGKIIVQTEQATLTDAVKKGEIDTTLTLNFSAMKTGTGGRVMKLADGVSITDNGLDLSNVSLTGKISDGDNVEYTIKITKGSILYQPDLSVGVKIDDYAVTEFHAVAGGTLAFDYDIEAAILKKFNFKIERSLAKFQKIAYQQIGYMPVIEVIEFEVIAGVEGASTAAVTANTGFDQKTEIEIGARYENRSWSPV